MRLIAAAAFAMLLFALAPTPASACSCAPGTPVQRLGTADAVFVGRLTDIEGPLGPVLSSLAPVSYHFDVERVLKGAVRRNTSVRSVVSGASCGLEGMREGERYTVFARLDGTTLSSGLCSGTHLGEPDLALSALSGVLLPPGPRPIPLWAIAAILVAIGLAVSRTVFWRRLTDR